MYTAEAIIVGAGPAGLAAAQRLGRAGLKPVIFDKSNEIGAVWRRHYDRLHLHTPRALSSLPGLPMPTSFGRYPSRAQFVDYLETYARMFGLSPRFNAPVRSIRREGSRWRAEVDGQTVVSPIAVIATGWADFPNLPRLPGAEAFDGPILHSSVYRNPAPFVGQRVLVVGFGNSGAEIALDLCEAGVATTLSVRSPVRVLPRELFGLPIVGFSVVQRFLPARVADALNGPFIRLAVGSIEQLGLKLASKGAIRMIEEDGRVPVIDVGTLAKIRTGEIKVRGALAGLARRSVTFMSGEVESFDAVIMATGFKPDLRALLPDVKDVLDPTGRPLVSDKSTSEPGLYFVGAIASPTGQLRQISVGANRIAEAALRFLRDERG